MLPQPGQELILADARVSPMKFPELVKFLIARRVAAPAGPELTSAFAAVLEPFATQPFITAVHRSDFANGSVVTVARTDGERDLVIHHPGADIAVFAREDTPPLATDAEVAVVTLDATNQAIRAFFAGGTFLQLGSRRLTAAALEGKITGVDPVAGKLRVRLALGSATPDLATLPGRVLHLSNSLRDTVQTITAATRDGDELVLTVKDDLRVGLLHVDSVEGTTVHSRTALRIFQIYRGTTLCNRADKPLATVLEAKDDGTLTLTAAPTGSISPSDDVWLVDAAVGETVRLPAILSWSK
jgi:hypothetical protein